ncbi:MAG: hypothetical protein HY000_36825 [Planctomycetes bacterium]|nr:hypothetical protein [Planctomycetota bacterium]
MASPTSKQAKTKAAGQRRTPLGKRLWKIRKQIEAQGQAVLSWQGVMRELRQRRGSWPCLVAPASRR